MKKQTISAQHIALYGITCTIILLIFWSNFPHGTLGMEGKFNILVLIFLIWIASLVLGAISSSLEIIRNIHHQNGKGQKKLISLTKVIGFTVPLIATLYFISWVFQELGVSS